MTRHRTDRFPVDPIGRVSRAVFALLSVCALASCGVAYNSPSVDGDDENLPVSILGMSHEVIARANATPYTPRSLPEAFFRSVATNGALARAATLPTAPFVPEQERKQLDFRPLPDVEAEQYRIGVGDVILLATSGQASTIEELSGLLAAQNQRQGYTVRDDGSIAIPEIGPVTILDLTLKEAEDRLFQFLVQNQIDPSFSLEVAEFNSKRVTIGGAVGNPKLVPITPVPLTLGEALVSAGGIVTKDQEFASIRIYREGALYQIPVERYVKSQDLQRKILLNGDAVYVDTTYDLDRALDFYETQLDVIALRSNARTSALALLNSEIAIQRDALEERRRIFEARNELGAIERDYVYVTGKVTRQNRFPLPFEQHASLADVLYEDGGFGTETGDPTQIYVLRQGSSDGAAPITAYHLNIKNAASLVFATKFQMRPDDVIFVEEQPITKWNRSLRQFFPAIVDAARSSI